MVPLLVLMVGSFMAVLNTSIINTAIPHMQRDLGVSFGDIAWVSTGYTLALGVVVPISNWLGDRIGTSLAHRLSMVGFALASALCGLAWNLESEICFRVIQAIPGGILSVMTLTILYQIVPQEKIGTAKGIYGLGVVVAPAVGPTLGGYLVEYHDWRLIFFINVPIGLLGAVAAYVVMPKLPPRPARRFDYLGFVTIGYGLVALLLATSKGQKWGWTSYPLLILVASGLLSLALFVVVENKVEYPLLNLRLLRHWPFTNSLLLISVLSVGLFAVSFYLPQFLQRGLRLSPLHAGVLLLPQALAMALFMPVAGRIYDRFGPKWPALIGLTLAAYGTYLLTGVNVGMSHQQVIDWTVVRGIGNGLAMMPIMTAGLNSLPQATVGYGCALLNLTLRVSASLGVAGMGALVSNAHARLAPDHRRGYHQQGQLHALTGAYGTGFLLIALLTACGVLLAVRIRKPTPARQL